MEAARRALLLHDERVEDHQRSAVLDDLVQSLPQVGSSPPHSLLDLVAVEGRHLGTT